MDITIEPVPPDELHPDASGIGAIKIIPPGFPALREPGLFPQLPIHVMVKLKIFGPLLRCEFLCRQLITSSDENV
jgi:hypothetical protein